MPLAQPVVVADGLIKSFKTRSFGSAGRRQRVKALDGIDLAVKGGAIHGIIGPNGSGKSTLLRVLATTVIPDSGTASVAGHDVVRQALAVRRLVGLSTGDERSVYWRLSARQNLEFAAALFDVPDSARAIAGVLELVGLEGEADRPVSGFSQGMVRRLALARALLHRPPVLLLDEPTRSLDPAAKESFHEILRRIQREQGATTLLTTHDLGEAVECCEQVSALRAGVVAGQVAPADEPSPFQAVSRLVS